MSTVLGLVADWANAAESERSDRQYFFESSHFRSIIGGSKIIVLGRKGAGKTALADHLSSIDKENYRSVGLKLESLDVPSDVSGSAFSNFEVLKKAWSKIILEAIAGLVLQDAKISPKEKVSIQQRLGLKSSPGTFIDRIRHIKVNASFLGVDLGVQANTSEATTNIDREIEALREFVEEKHWSKTKKLAVIFDGLDDGYIQAWQAGHQTVYFRTITALLAAAVSEKNYFQRLAIPRQILPTVFIRSDIFDQLVYQQKSAWRSDQSIELVWTEAELQEFCHHRILQSAREIYPDIESKAALAEVFKTQTGLMETFSGASKKIPLVKYVIDYSLGRPRDVVMYMKRAAEKGMSQKAGGKSRITKPLIEETRRDYGLFLKDEINDELGGEYPIVGIMLNRIAGAGQSSMSMAQFATLIKSIHGSDALAGDAYSLAERLFGLGFFGHLMADGTRRFAIKDPDIQFNDLLPLVVHPCYALALNLARTVPVAPPQDA